VCDKCFLLNHFCYTEGLLTLLVINDFIYKKERLCRNISDFEAVLNKKNKTQ
ncbi:hypothetical protein M5D96_013543, partial [Drosophila gunungcola]